MFAQKHITASCAISKNIVYKDDIEIFKNSDTDLLGFFVSIYQHFQLSYPKFYKMDNLCKLGIIAAEVLLKDEALKTDDPYATGIVLSNSNSSLDTDIKYYATVANIASPAKVASPG